MAADFVCADWSRRIVDDILEGRTYPHFDFIANVGTILDVGANVGAAATYFARAYPAARVYAFEPSPDCGDLLRRNTSGHPNVEALSFGLDDTDRTARLYRGHADKNVLASLSQNAYTVAAYDIVELRSAAGWCRDRQIEAVDILKVDTEGGEVPIFRSLQPWLSRVKVIHVECHSDSDRRTIDQMLSGTHTLVTARGLRPTVEFSYVHEDYADAAQAWAHRRFV